LKETETPIFKAGARFVNLSFVALENLALEKKELPWRVCCYFAKTVQN
jgi:hypothetical protein